MRNEKKAHEEVTVIGAGMAGIMAARTLHNAGWPVTVLEARDRIGGRTHTDQSLGCPIDLGGAWIHGPYGNPLTGLARKYNVATGYTDFVNASGTAMQAFDADGTPLDMAEFSYGLQLASGMATHVWSSLLYDVPRTDVRSLADLYEDLPPTPRDLSPTAQKGYYYTAVIRTQYGNAADLTEIDCQLPEDYVKLPGGDLLIYGGYNAITDRLAEGLDITTESVVSHVSYDKDGVTLTTNRGAIHSDRVIITVPVGVLKAGNIHFRPALPPEKCAAIERIGFGNYEKLALRFSDFFWPRDIQRFAWLTDRQPSLFTSWLNTGHYTGEPVIVAYHSGSRAKVVNQMSDSELIEAALDGLTIMFGDNLAGEIPAPTNYVRTNWQNDPYACGSYTFTRVGQQAGDRAALARPVADRLFFAGEATHPHYHATVHGAYETGIRAAREVMACQGASQRFMIPGSADY